MPRDVESCLRNGNQKPELDVQDVVSSIVRALTCVARFGCCVCWWHPHNSAKTVRWADHEQSADFVAWSLGSDSTVRTVGANGFHAAWAFAMVVRELLKRLMSDAVWYTRLKSGANWAWSIFSRDKNTALTSGPNTSELTSGRKNSS